MICTNCGKKHFARGLCQACYYRLRRNGSVARKYVINSGKCSVDGCERDAFAKNLCQQHYNRADHPLKATWKLLRSRHKGEYPDAWESFEVFLADVGPRPTPRHQLRRLNAASPFTKENVGWLEPIGVDRRRGQWDRKRIEDYDRTWNLKRKYGISVQEYETFLVRQNGVCAICGNKESHVHKSGKLKDLAVDHCHDSKQVRGLLCFNCNQGLGRFQDNIEHLHRAIEYLRKSKT